MNNLKILDKINDLIDRMDYKKAYLEIETSKDKFIIEKEKQRQIGFRGGG